VPPGGGGHADVGFGVGVGVGAADGVGVGIGARLTAILNSPAVAELQIDGTDLVLHLRAMEKAEGAHSDIRVPLSAVTAVRAVDDPWPELRGIRAPGTGLPNVIAVGTRRGGFGKDFAAVHGKGPAVVVELEGAD
jgi:hypothetical protein